MLYPQLYRFYKPIPISTRKSTAYLNLTWFLPTWLKIQLHTSLLSKATKKMCWSYRLEHSWIKTLLTESIMPPWIVFFLGKDDEALKQLYDKPLNADRQHYPAADFAIGRTQKGRKHPRDNLPWATWHAENETSHEIISSRPDVFYNKAKKQNSTLLR